MKNWGYLLALLTLLQILSASLYLGKTSQFGFPLDDAWIHQTYACNLGLNEVVSLLKTAAPVNIVSCLQTVNYHFCTKVRKSMKYVIYDKPMI
jgi:hypothetical protein